MIYILGYFLTGLVLGIIVARVERDEILAYFTFFFWPFVLPAIIVMKFFQWIVDL